MTNNIHPEENAHLLTQRKALQAAAQARDLPQLKTYAAEYNLLPPPWVTLPHAHPASIGWRMGYGEGFIDLWSDWWDATGYTEAEQVEYFRAWKPPHAWLEWVICTLWPDVQEEYFDTLEEDEEAARALLSPYFARLDALGFGSFADWKADYEREDWQ